MMKKLEKKQYSWSVFDGFNANKIEYISSKKKDEFPKVNFFKPLSIPDPCDDMPIIGGHAEC
jgi:hypothetical protein